MPKTKQPLEGYVFCLSGALTETRAKITKTINLNGGRAASTVTNSVTHLVTTIAETAGVHTAKVIQAEGKGVPIVAETFLRALLDGKKPKLADHLLLQPAAGQTTKKATTKKRAAKADTKGKKKQKITHDDDDEDEDEDDDVTMATDRQFKGYESDNEDDDEEEFWDDAKAVCYSTYDRGNVHTYEKLLEFIPKSDCLGTFQVNDFNAIPNQFREFTSAVKGWKSGSAAHKKYLAQFKWFADDNHPDNTTYYAFWMYPKVAKLPAATAETAPIVAFGPSGMHVVASDIRTFCCLLGAQFNGDVLANIIKHKMKYTHIVPKTAELPAKKEDVFRKWCGDVLFLQPYTPNVVGAAVLAAQATRHNPGGNWP